MKNTHVTVFLVSLKAGGVALNLTEASRVYLMDSWWNPAVRRCDCPCFVYVLTVFPGRIPCVNWRSHSEFELTRFTEAMDRIHRLGQHRPVQAIKLVIEDSIESRIIQLQEKKSAMVDATLSTDDSVSHLIHSSLRYAHATIIQAMGRLTPEDVSTRASYGFDVTDKLLLLYSCLSYSE